MGSDQNRGCNTGLSLDLLGFSATTNTGLKKVERPVKYDHVYPGLSLGPVVVDQGFSVSPGSSSYSNNNSVKRSLDQDKELVGSLGEEAEVDKGSSRPASDEEEEEEEASPRKKLRLNKDQAAVLEDSFKEHSTLNPHQKQALAKRLNLRPRQVEVWFQNRRARTKLKQTEMDCELLKKCCETLTEENKRLQKEVHDLKALKLATPAVYMQVPSPTLSMCPSCERFVSSAAPPHASDHRRHRLTPSPQGGPASVFPNINGTKPPPQFFTTHSSAAC